MDDHETVESPSSRFQWGEDANLAGQRAMLVALSVGLVITVLKFCAYGITGSSAILSDALESIINVVASGFALGSLLLSAKPPDESHPYGHGKIEYFSAGFEGALIMLAAGGIFAVGFRQILTPRELPHLQSGLLILLGVSAANLVLGLSLVRIGKRIRSLALIADGRHILTDVYTSVGVVAGLVLVYLTGWNGLDGIVACAVGIQIVRSGYSLVREAFAGLMDESDPTLLDEICSILETNRKDVWIDVHRLRAKRAGRRVQVDFHLILPRDFPLDAGHAEVKRVEQIFSDHFGEQADVMVHLDPCADPECPICRHEPCTLRQEDSAGHKAWKREELVREAENE